MTTLHEILKREIKITLFTNNNLKNMNEIKKSKTDEKPVVIDLKEIEDKIAVIRGQEVIADADVAWLYRVETKRVNEAVRNNRNKFPISYMFELTNSELKDLRSNISSTNVSPMNRNSTKVFTERGLYMLATILKSERATEATFAIIETFAMVRELKRELLQLHKETDKKKQTSMMKHFGDVLSDIVMPDLTIAETDSTLELNFFIGKLKHTVKRVKQADKSETKN